MKSQNILKKLLSKSKVTKQDIITEGKEALGYTNADLIGLAKDNRDRVPERSREILDKLLYGEGLKILR